MAKNLTRTDAVESGDLFVLSKNSAGDYRGASAQTVLDYISANAATGEFVTQSVVVSASGTNVNVTDNGKSIWLIIRPAAAYAAMTITLPLLTNAVDGQEVMVFCTQAITTLTVNGNGAVDVAGEPSALSTNDHFRLRFDSTSNTWFRVG